MWLVPIKPISREQSISDFLNEVVLPEMIVTKKYFSHILKYECGSSTGEEAYTIAIVLSEFAENIHVLILVSLELIFQPRLFRRQ